MRMTAARQRAEAICRRVRNEGRIAEVGVLIGALSREILAKRSDVWLEMVDNWLPMAQQPEAYIATGDDHALHDKARAESHYRQAQRVADESDYRAHIWRGNSVDVAKFFADRSMDMIFLDADHSFEGVTADLAAWAGKVKPGGWIGGHDYRNPDPRFRFGVTEAVDAWAAKMEVEVEVDLNFTWFARL